MFENFDIAEEKLLQYIDYLQKDLTNYQNSDNPKELVIKIKKRALTTINNYINAVDNTIELCSNIVDRMKEFKAKSRRLEIENNRIKENYKKLQLYARAHGIDVDLVEHYSQLKDFTA